MALTAGQIRRPRSSTAASQGLNANEQSTGIAELCRQLTSASPFLRDHDCEEVIVTAGNLRQALAASPTSKDVFRRAGGLGSIVEAINELCQTGDEEGTPAALPSAKAVAKLLPLLSTALSEHRGNERYFTNRLNGWSVLQKSLLTFLDAALTKSDREQHLDLVGILLAGVLQLAFGETDGDRFASAVELRRDEIKSSGTVDEQQAQKLVEGHETVLQPQSCALAVRMLLRVFNNQFTDQGAPLLVLSRSMLPLIHATVGLCLRNQFALWETGIMSHLILTWLDRNTTEECRGISRSFIELLKGFGLSDLDDAALVFQRACESDEARAMLLGILQASKSPAVIQFDLSQSGHSSVELKSLPRPFPPTTGYSLAAWFRFDEFDPRTHTTLFGAFDETQTCFLLAYLERDSRSLILQTSIRAQKPSVRFKSTKFAPGKWYHVAIVHRRATADPRQSPVMLFVDGEFAEQVKIGYPETPLLDEPHSRELPMKSQRQARAVQAFFGTPADLAFRLGRNQITERWSLASAHLYQVPLTDELVAVHHKLGPRYYGNMQDCLGPLLTYQASAELNRYNELLHPDKSEKSDIVTATENRGSDVMPESRLLLSISPMAILNPDASNVQSLVAQFGLDKTSRKRYEDLVKAGESIAINTAIPTISDALGRSYGTAVLKGDPVVVLPKPLDDMAWCLSGCLPLLLTLVESATSKTALLQATEIVFECVKDSWRISEAMEKGNGFGILALIIREKLGLESGASANHVTSRKPSAMLNFEDRQALPLELLHLILRFVGYDKQSPENSMIVNPMGYRVLLVDFDTWRRCDAETQKVYYEQFIHFIGRNKHHGFNQKRLARMRVLKRLLEALKFEDVPQDCVSPLLAALRGLIDIGPAQSSYKDLAMYIAFGLHDERAQQNRPIKNIASAVKIRQRAASWARRGSSRPTTPGGPSMPPVSFATRHELAVHILELLAEVLSDDRSPLATKRFVKAVPPRWLSHMLSETDVRVVELTVRIICRCLSVMGSDFKTPFVDKNGGFVTLKARLKIFWRSPSLWLLAFAMLFGRNVPAKALQQGMSVFGMVEALQVSDELRVLHPEMLQPIMNMLEAALRDVVKTDEPAEPDAKIVKCIMQFLSELYARSAHFREFASTSRYVQEMLFVLYPVIVGSDRLSASMEYEADKDSLSFKGEAVVMRPHSNSIGERPPSVRSLQMEGEKRPPSPNKRITAPRRLSSFVLVNDGARKPSAPAARFNQTMAPKSLEPVRLNVGNSLVESLLEVCVNLFLDMICNKKEFNGLGLFLKVPPGFREHQAYFESYVLVHTLSQLWNHLQLDQALLQETRVLTNLGRFCLHITEAVFEGWFINGAQPVIDFIGKVLDYLQQPDVAAIKSVRLCAQATNTMRVVFLRVMLLRLSELDESVDELEAIGFLDQMNYWQTILFSTENQETPFIRLICYLLYMKLTTTVRSVRFAAARLWRTMLMQKPTETATLLTYAMGSEQRHLSTGFMKLVSLDDEEFVSWVDENRKSLDIIFVDALAKPWDDFVKDENQRNEESAKARLSKRKDKLRQWQTEESSVDDFLQRYEVSTSHWRANVHAQEKLKLQRSMQDHQENVHLIFTIFARLDHLMRQPCGLNATEETTKWQLDETEGANRMRLRTLPDQTPNKEIYQSKRKYSERSKNSKLAVNTQVTRPLRDNILSATPNTPADATDGTSEQPIEGRPRGDSISNSQLLEGGFEMVDDPQEGEDGVVEDKNRKVMTSLQRGDMVQQLYNISRIVGLEACEGLLVIGKKCLYLQDSFFQRSDGEIVSVAQAPEDEKDPYVQLISGKDIGSQRNNNNIGEQASRNWTWMEVLSISKRRFLFRDVSLEVFFTDGRSYLLTCIGTQKRDELYSAIVTRAPHVHSTTTVASEDAWRLDNLRNPEEAPQTLGSRFASVIKGGTAPATTKKWIKGDMSNFQYLMLINTMAGRSFNDLTQYPVFPWVLADYSSEDLDLTNPKTFRDFSKPMGCQTPLREAEYKDRYKQFAEMGDENAPPFHYGTHYSSAMIVTSYLIRMQPFVQSYLLLQGGKFDHADRLFDSIERAWLSSSRENMTDVRELTPEFYYLPEFLTNINGYDFGSKQGSDELVGDVKLPPWAKGDPHIFISKHREALESPYVSERLHQWVDLIFGFKQRGEAAIESTNVFQHLSYGGAKDLDNIEDPLERLATIGIIHSFGQTPYQVFPRPHPGRETEKFNTARLDTMAESLTRLPAPLFEINHKVANLIFSPTQDRLIPAGPCTLNMLPNCDRYVQWGYADHSLRFFSSNTKRLLGLYENTHIGPVTAAAFADSKTLITAGADCTLAIWTVNKTRDAIEIDWKTYLFGHRAAITILAASRVFSTLLSVSADGQVLLWDLNRHDCIRSLLPPTQKTVQAAQISSTSGHIVLCRGNHVLLFTLNGHLLLDQKISSENPDEQILSAAFYNGAANEWVERELLFTGHPHGVVNVWALTSLSDGAWHLQLVNRLNHADSSREDGGNIGAGISALLPMAGSVYTGDEEGRVWEWGVMNRHMGVSLR
ncbi:hypothetical protein Q7P36_004519 [Cladosporium allicinum]